jgi:hypothetical protein
MSSFTLLALWFGVNAIWGTRLARRKPDVAWLAAAPLVGGTAFAGGALYAGLTLVGASVARGTSLWGFHVAWSAVALLFAAWTAGLVRVSRRTEPPAA